MHVRCIISPAFGFLRFLCQKGPLNTSSYFVMGASSGSLLYASTLYASAHDAVCGCGVRLRCAVAAAAPICMESVQALCIELM